MPVASADTLKNILLTSNSVGVTVHENEGSITNFVAYHATPRHYIYMHGRDVIDPEKARYDEKGKLLLKRDHSKTTATRVSNLVNDVFSITESQAHKEDALKAIKHVLGKHLSSDLTYENRRQLKRDLTAAIDSTPFKEKLGKTKFDVFLEDVKAEELLPDRENPLVKHESYRGGSQYTGNVPFTESAIATVEHYLSQASLEERKPWVALNSIPAKSFENKLVRRLDKKYPGVLEMYEQALVKEKERRIRVNLSPDEEMDENYKQLCQVIAVHPEQGLMLKAMLEPQFKKHGDKMVNPFNDDGTTDLGKLKEMMYFLRDEAKKKETEGRQKHALKLKDNLEEARLTMEEEGKPKEEIEKRLWDFPMIDPDFVEKEIPDTVPMLALATIQNDIFAHITKFTGQDMLHGHHYMEESTALLREEYDLMSERGVFEENARKILENVKMAVPANELKNYTKKIHQCMEALKAYEYDEQEALNMATGLRSTMRNYAAQEEKDNLSGKLKKNTPLKPKPIDELPEELRLLGLHERAKLELVDLTEHMGNPFSGRLMLEEGKAVHEIVTSVPNHIVQQACKDGMKLSIAIGDPFKSKVHIRGQSNGFSMAGGYYSSVYDHPFIQSSNELLASSGIARKMGELVRHEFRHYWNDRTGALGHKEMQRVGESDREPYIRLREAILADTPDQAQQELVDKTLKSLHLPDLDDLRKRVTKLDRTNADWTNAERQNKHGYAFDATQFEEALPRIDESILEFGQKTARYFFPECTELMARVESEFKAKHKNHVPDWPRGAVTAPMSRLPERRSI